MRLRPAIATTLASVSVIVAGFGAFWQATDGLAAFTTEAARRIAIAHAPVRVPATDILMSDGASLVLPNGSRPLLVEFIYTSCPTICTELGQEFLQIQSALVQRGLADRVKLVSLSFDIERDTPARLAEYGKFHASDPAVWTVGRPRSQHDLAGLLGAFGVTVVPDGEGGFVHNAAIHYVGRDGRLSRIFDLGEVDSILAYLETVAL